MLECAVCRAPLLPPEADARTVRCGACGADLPVTVYGLRTPPLRRPGLRWVRSGKGLRTVALTLTLLAAVAVVWAMRDVLDALRGSHDGTPDPAYVDRPGLDESNP